MEGFVSPNIFDFLNANLYLQEYYRFRKASAEGFSYEAWADGIGITSKSYLRYGVLGKRNISEELAQRLANFIQLNEQEKEYFFLLILYTQASQPETKLAYGKRLSRILRSHTALVEVNPHPCLLSQPLYMAIRNILSFVDAPRTAPELARILNISETEITGILYGLEENGFVKLAADGWYSTHADVKIQDAPKNESILSYHKQILTKAIEAQQRPSHQRHYRSLGLPLSEEEYTHYLKDLDMFAKETYAKYGKDSIVHRRLYQINFNLFPWTETIGT